MEDLWFEPRHLWLIPPPKSFPSQDTLSTAWGLSNTSPSGSHFQSVKLAPMMKPTSFLCGWRNQATERLNVLPTVSLSCVSQDCVLVPGLVPLHDTSTTSLCNFVPQEPGQLGIFNSLKLSGQFLFCRKGSSVPLVMVPSLKQILGSSHNSGMVSRL